jgi:hypothetical protein
MKLHALDIASIVGFPKAFQLSSEPKYVIAAEHVWDYFECNLTAIVLAYQRRWQSGREIIKSQ